MHRLGTFGLALAAGPCLFATITAAQEITVVYGLGGPAPAAARPSEASAPGAEVRMTAGPRIIVLEAPRTRAATGAGRPGAVANPVPVLLADPTLRAGDVAMFPDGARVYVGAPWRARTLDDFMPVRSAQRSLPPPLRDRLMALRPGWNAAWDAHGAAPAMPTEARFARRPVHGFEVVRVGR